MYILCPFPKLLIYSKLKLFHSYIPVQLGTRRLSVCMPFRLFIKKGEKSFMFLIWKMNLFPFIKFPRQRQILFGGSINKKKIKFNFTKKKHISISDNFVLNIFLMKWKKKILDDKQGILELKSWF